MSQQTVKLHFPPIRKKIVGAVIVVIIAAFVVFAFFFTQSANRPQPEITIANKHEFFQDLHYVCEVDVTVENNGADGWVNVHAEISGAGKPQKQDQKIYLASGQGKSLQFVFYINLWGTVTIPYINFEVWAVAN